MFAQCRVLTSLDVSNFNTENVTDMNLMFYECRSLPSLTFGNNFNTANVTTMAGMFQSCSVLTSLDLTHFNTANVTDMHQMFYDCWSLTSLTFGKNFNTANVTDMSYMFYSCSVLTSLDLSNFNTEKVTTMASMFYGCSNLTSLDVSKFNTANVTSMNQMFYNCSQLTELDVSHFDTGKVTNMGSMFSGCSHLTELDVSKFNTANVKYMSYMFSGCSGLASLDVSKFNTEKVTTMSYMFSNCSSLTSLDVSKFNTEKVTNMSYMFSGCSGLTKLYVRNFNTANVTNMDAMFRECSSLTSLTFGENFTTASCTSYKFVFLGCTKLRYLDFYESNDKFDDSDATKSTKFFTEANLNREASPETALFGSMVYKEKYNQYHGLPLTTVIYMPHQIDANYYTQYDTRYWTLPNLVYCPGEDPWAFSYYSEDKVEIELPREFKTTKAEYSRTMSNNYGSVVLPYAFKTDANIQAYTLDEEHTETMLFKDATTVAAHTPFAFKKLQSGNTADFVMTDQGFGITVKATHTTSAEEGGEPYTHNENLDGWTTKGYYINETVDDYNGAFYIAGDKFYKASAALTLYPHRVTFHGAWTKSGTSGDARFYNINTVSDSETITAIEAADLRHTRSVAAEVYDVVGRRLPEMVKGLNIVRMNDGSVRKVNIR